MLHEFIAGNHDEIIRRCRAKVASRPAKPSTEGQIDRGVPVFLHQLAEALRPGATSGADIGGSALQNGHDLLLQGVTVSQLVHRYGDVCQAITELALETDTTIGTDDFRRLNQCLDDAIACAVTEYGRGRTQSALDAASAHGIERLGFLAHELRNLINTAILAFEVLRRGDVGVAGSTGAVLHRSLRGLEALVVRSLAEVRLTVGVQNLERFELSGFIDELASAAAVDGGRVGEDGERLIVMPMERGMVIEADRQVLAAAVRNLLQNALKFTRPGTTVTLRVTASAERVLIEIEDECGGLPTEDANELFRPFEQRGDDRTGLGLGLPFSRLGVEASNGRLYARNLPDRGCVFTVDLPRFPSLVVA
jgi:signal transduction histidine kinase